MRQSCVYFSILRIQMLLHLWLFRDYLLCAFFLSQLDTADQTAEATVHILAPPVDCSLFSNE